MDNVAAHKQKINRGFSLAVGADHAGRDLALYLIAQLSLVGTQGHQCTRFVPAADEYWDYADPAQTVSKLVQTSQVDRGVLISSSGMGMSMVSNRFKGVRCALVSTRENAILSRTHLNANCLALGAHLLLPDTAWLILRTWLQTPFAHGVHEQQLHKIDAGVDLG